MGRCPAQLRSSFEQMLWQIGGGQLLTAIAAVLIPLRTQLVPTYWLPRAAEKAAWQVYGLVRRTVKNPGSSERHLTCRCGTLFALCTCSRVGLLNISHPAQMWERRGLTEEASFFPLKIKSASNSSVFGVFLRLLRMILPRAEGIFLHSDSPSQPRSSVEGCKFVSLALQPQQ